MKLLSLALIICVLSGCAAKKPVGTNLLIPRACLTGDPELIGCTNLHLNPPNCKKAKIRYEKGCEIIEVKR